MVKIKKVYDVIDAQVFVSDKPSETKQSMKSECDVNDLIKKYPNMLDNGLSMLQSGQFAGFDDLSLLPGDLQDAMDLIEEANSRFMELPSRVRDRFDNNPEQLLEFLSKSENLEESYSLGLRIRPENSVSEAIELTPATPVAGEVK